MYSFSVFALTYLLLFFIYKKKVKHKFIIRDDSGSSRARIVPTHNPTHKKKICPLPVRLFVGYLLKKYLRIFLKSAGTRGYPILANI